MIFGMIREMAPIPTPLPYSAFPEDLAPLVGAMTVAFQSIEDEIPTLIELIINADEEVVGVFLNRVPISAQIEFVKNLSKICIEDEAEILKINELCKKVGVVRKNRNDFIHSRNLGFNKQTGEVFQASRGRLNIHGAEEFEMLINRMYLLIVALVNRRFDVEEWDTSLRYWDRPEQYWEEHPQEAQI